MSDLRKSIWDLASGIRASGNPLWASGIRLIDSVGVFRKGAWMPSESHSVWSASLRISRSRSAHWSVSAGRTMFGLTAPEDRRAAISVVSNIAEGCRTTVRP